MNKIEMNVNNGRTLSLIQHESDRDINIMTTDSEGIIQTIDNINAGDMVMLLNYYRYQKDHGLEIF